MLPIFKRLQVNQFVLDRSPQPLNEDVVMTTSSPIHANLYTNRFETLRERFRGELAATIHCKSFFWVSVKL
jgi:hypothetical protein